MSNVSNLLWKIWSILTPNFIAGCILALIFLLGAFWTIGRGMLSRYVVRRAQARNGMDGSEQVLADAYKRDGRFPAPLTWKPTKFYSLSNQTVLPDAGFGQDRLDAHTDRRAPFRYATDGQRWVLIGAGPDSRWDFDISKWTPEMTAESEAVKAMQFIEENGRWGGGDNFLFGTAPK